MKKLSNKFTAFVFTLLLAVSLLAPNPVYGFQDGGDSNEKKLRKGSCWLDGTPNCRKKKEGNECSPRNHCSAQSYITAIAGVVAIGSAIDKL